MNALAGGDYDTAVQRFQKFLDRYARDPRAPEAAFQAGEAERLAGNHHDAITYYNRVLNSYPTSGRCEDASYFIGYCMIMNGDHRAALDLYIGFIRTYPNGHLTDDAWFVLGRTYEQLGDPADAVTCYRELLTKFPRSEFCNDARARLRILAPGTVPPSYPPSSDPDEEHLSDRELYDNGHTYLTSGNQPMARRYFDWLLERYPRSPWADDAMYWKGRSYFEERNWREAAKILADFLFRYQNSELRPDAQYEYAWCLYQDGLSSPTNKTTLQKAATKFSSFSYGYSDHAWAAEALYMAGECYDRLGNPSTARRYFQETVTRYPSSTSAQKAKERLNGTY